MRIGKFGIDWELIDESSRIKLGLDPWIYGWEAFCISWGEDGWMFYARARKGWTA